MESDNDNISDDGEYTASDDGCMDIEDQITAGTSNTSMEDNNRHIKDLLFRKSSSDLSQEGNYDRNYNLSIDFLCESPPCSGFVTPEPSTSSYFNTPDRSYFNTPNSSIPNSPNTSSPRYDYTRDNTSDDDTPPSTPAPKKKTRAPHSLLRKNVLRDSLRKAQASIDMFCCVCCRLLPIEDINLLKIPLGVDINTIQWPCLQYGRAPTKKDGRLTTCKTHHILNKKSQDFVCNFENFVLLILSLIQVLIAFLLYLLPQINFVNIYWPNPRHRVYEALDPADSGEIPDELSRINLADVPYICLVVAFMNFRQENHSRALFPHIQGRVSIYRSKKRLSSNDGMSSLLSDKSLLPEDHTRIRRAWKWLVSNNLQYRGLKSNSRRVPHASRRSQKIIEDPEHPPSNREDFPAEVLQTLDPGPRAADTNLEDVTIGLDQDNNGVTFSDPYLLAKLFPELYPFGLGCFALWHYKTSLRNPHQRHLGHYSIRDYAKYRLLHFDRRFAQNNRFIVFMSDWINKNTVHGFLRRTTTPFRGQGQPTRVKDILTGRSITFIILK